MTSQTISLALSWLLLMRCPGNRLFGELAPVAAVRLDAKSGSDGRETSRSSSCQPLDDFVACYDVVVPIFTEVPAENYRRIELPVSLTTVGHPFRLRLHVEPLDAGDDDKATNKSALFWSWVISPSTLVHVAGADGLVREFTQDQLGIKWFVGYDELEVAPSAVLGSEVDFSDQKQFRAVIFTISDVYYVEPAADYPQVAYAIHCVRKK